MILAWCLVIGLELFLLFDDIILFKSPKAELLGSTGKRVAELREIEGGVRWQSPKDVVWIEGETGQTLFGGQSLMTLSDGKARLVFDAFSAEDSRLPATEIEVGSRTLIQLNEKAPSVGGESPLLLSLERGSLQAKTLKPLVLTSGEFQIRIEPHSKFRAVRDVTSDGKKPLRILLTEGSATAVNAKGATTRLRAGEELETAVSGDLSAPVVSTPAPSPSPSVTPSPSLTPIPTPAPVAKPEKRLPPPKIRAPILRPKAHPAPTPVEKSAAFFLDLFSRFIPSAHAEEEQEWEIELQWEVVPGASSYQIQIGKTRNFAHLIVDTTSNVPVWIWVYRKGMENSKGRVFYRIAAITRDGKVGSFSEARTLVIPRVITMTPTSTQSTPPPVQSRITPPSPPASVPAATPPTPSLPTATISERFDFSRRPLWTLSPLASLSSFTQSTDFPFLSRVETKSPYFHESFMVERRSGRFDFTFALLTNHFEEELTGTLKKVRSFTLSADLTKKTSWLGERLFLGAGVVLSDRFEKTGPNSLGLKRGISLGPVARYHPPRNSGTRGILPQEWSATLELPLTGLIGTGFLGGPYGPVLKGDFAWKVGRFGTWGVLDFRTHLEGSMLSWDAPAGTTTTRWMIAIGPSLVIL